MSNKPSARRSSSPPKTLSNSKSRRSRSASFAERLANFSHRKARAPFFKVLAIAKATQQLANRDAEEIDMAIGSLQHSPPELEKEYRNFERYLQNRAATAPA
jgi:hypothetical protein